MIYIIPIQWISSNKFRSELFFIYCRLRSLLTIVAAFAASQVRIQIINDLTSIASNQIKSNGNRNGDEDGAADGAGDGIWQGECHDHLYVRLLASPLCVWLVYLYLTFAFAKQRIQHSLTHSFIHCHSFAAYLFMHLFAFWRMFPKNYVQTKLN